MIDVMLFFAFSQLGFPYIYGANGGGAYDCSSFVLQSLRTVGMASSEDNYSQGIYNHYSNQNLRSRLAKGALLFFGEGRNNIEHVAIALDDKYLIECGGGDSTTKTLEDARKRGAQVRIRPINYRRDLQAVIMPDYIEHNSTIGEYYGRSIRTKGIKRNNQICD